MQGAFFGQRKIDADAVAREQAGRRRHLYGAQHAVGLRRQREQLERRGGEAVAQHGAAVADAGG